MPSSPISIAQKEYGDSSYCWYFTNLRTAEKSRELILDNDACIKFIKSYTDFDLYHPTLIDSDKWTRYWEFKAVKPGNIHFKMAYNHYWYLHRPDAITAEHTINVVE